MKQTAMSNLVIALAMAATLALVGCESDNGGGSPADVVGTWIGTVDGSGGPATVTVVLNANGSCSAQGNIAFYGRVTGTYTVSGNQLTATMSDGGLVISYSGTVSGNSMSGTWSGNNGTSGSFNVTRQ